MGVLELLSFGFSKVSDDGVFYNQSPNVCALLKIHFLQFSDCGNLRLREAK